MSRSIACIAAILFAALALGQANMLPAVPEYVPGELLIKFHPGVTANQISRLARRYGVAIAPSIAGNGVMKLRGARRWNVLGACAALSSDPAVEYAEPNGIVHACYPNDPLYGQQFAPPLLNWPQAMALYKGNPNIIVAIIDSGVQLNHEDLAKKIVPGWNYVGGNNIPNDDYHHGTHVAGIAAAITDNSLGVAGTCPGCSIMPIKVLDSGGNGSWENLAAGINYAAANGAHVINLSLGAFSQNTTAQTAVQNAAAAGLVIAAAAGNGASSNMFYPAAYPECIAVGATDANDFKASFTDYNSGQNQWVDVAAPGVSILSTWNNGSYAFDSGTSMSCPFVAGEAALLYGLLTDPLSPAPRSVDLATRVRSLIENNCKALTNQGDWVTHGRIDLLAAVTAGMGPITATGNVELQQFLVPTTVPVTIQVMSPGTTTVVETKTVNLDASGNYSTSFNSFGLYDLRFSTSSHFLARRVTNVALSRVTLPVVLPSASLPNGDATLDGAVNLPDLSAVLADFNTAGGPADLDGDGWVHLSDLSTVLASFDLHSDP